MIKSLLLRHAHFIAIAVPLIAIAAIIPLMIRAQVAAREDCESKGGVYKCNTSIGTGVSAGGHVVSTSSTSCVCYAKGVVLE